MKVKVRTSSNWLRICQTIVEEHKFDKTPENEGQLSEGYGYGYFKGATEFDSIEDAKSFIKEHNVKMFETVFVEV